MNRIVALIVVAATCAWSLGIVRTCWFAGDYMIGFSPFILFGLPFASIVLIVGLGISASRKSKLVATCSIVGCALVVAPLFNMHRITRSAWQKSLADYTKTNQTALLDADLSSVQFTDTDFPDDRKMIAIDGFKWYCEQHHAAPDGKFRGFLYNSIQHVYVNKIRHGFRGIAWIPNPEMIPPTSEYDYHHSGVDNWYIWTYGG
jgi:hypothetical protein